MLDSVLTEALARLDTLLLHVCDAEERRAAVLAGDGASGWDGVRNLARPTVGALLSAPLPERPLVPPGPSPLSEVAAAFGLAAEELDALVVLLAPHLEPRYRALYGVLQDAMTEPWCTERLLLTVLGRSPSRRARLLATLGPDGRLVGTGLVTRGAAAAPQARTLDLAPEVRAALLGLPLPTVVDGIGLDRMAATEGAEPPPFCVVYGPGDPVPALQALGGLEALLTGRIRDGDRAARVGRSLWRIGALTGVWPVVDLSGLDEHVARRVAERLWLGVRQYGGRLTVLASEALPLAVPQREAPRSTWVERRRAWIEQASARGLKLAEGVADRFASAYRLGPRAIAEVLDSAEGADETSLVAQVVRLSRARIPHGNRVEARRTFDDIVLMDTTREALDRLVYFVHHRDRISEARGLEHRFKLRRGPIVLFAGRSGTGKTLAAEVVAGKLGRPLHVVDLARLVSKYIGETESNIDEVLTAGERAGAVLFFDEADSLFSQRTEVSNSNDRFANLEVGYLLQRIEQHDGLVILATNLRQSIDEAFLRRFHTRIEFPMPGPLERSRIWRLMLPPGVRRSDRLQLEQVAREHRLSGGDIRNAALKAIFLAESEDSPVTRSHLERAVALELLELGRLSRREALQGADLPARDRGALLRAFTQTLQEEVEQRLREVFLKEVQTVHGSPTKENLAGKRPAVSLALFRLAKARTGMLTLGFVVSAWSTRAEEEHELLGVLHQILSEGPVREVAGRMVTSKVAESVDFDLLHRFWSSHGHPVRASVVLDVEVG